jgi:NitT/TauT family transport system substrate-binding protein
VIFSRPPPDPEGKTMSYVTRRAIIEGLTAIALGTLGLVGCDSKTEGGATGPAGSATSAAGPTKTTATRGGEAPTTPSGREFTIAWSVWTGWMPFKLMDQKGFLATRAKEHGVKVKLQEFKGYMDSVQAFAAQKVDGCAMTSMESLQPASNGVDSVAILVNDTSNGGDGVLVRGNLDIKGLKGQTVLLEEMSVSHYLLARALATAGMKEADVKIKNIPGDDAGKAFLTDPKVVAVTTWNPHLFKAVEGGKGKVIFSSKDIPGEIIDLLVMNGKALKESPKLATVLTEAWYDAMQAILNPATRAESIEIMAKAAGGLSVEEFNKMLADTDLYTDRAKAGAFLESDTIKSTMEKVKKFSFDHGLIKDDKFAVGFGSSGPEKLRFDASYVRAGK